MRNSFEGQLNQAYTFTPEELHAMEWSTVALSGLKDVISHYQTSNGRGFNNMGQFLYEYSPTSISYHKKHLNNRKYIEGSIIDGFNFTYLANLDKDSQLPVKYIDQLVSCEAQMIISNYPATQEHTTYEFYKNIDNNSHLMGYTTIVKNNYKQRIYIKSNKLFNKYEFTDCQLESKFIKTRPSSVIDADEVHFLINQLPEINHKRRVIDDL